MGGHLAVRLLLVPAHLPELWGNWPAVWGKKCQSNTLLSTCTKEIGSLSCSETLAWPLLSRGMELGQEKPLCLKTGAWQI